MSEAPKIKFAEINEDTSETEHELPAKYEVCPRCSGKGTHVNPSVDGNGLTHEAFAEDPDFEEAYFAGAYDVECYECKGKRVVPVADEERCDPGLLEKYQEHLKLEAEMRREDALAAKWGW